MHPATDRIVTTDEKPCVVRVETLDTTTRPTDSAVGSWSDVVGWDPGVTFGPVASVCALDLCRIALCLSPPHATRCLDPADLATQFEIDEPVEGGHRGPVGEQRFVADDDRATLAVTHDHGEFPHRWTTEQFGHDSDVVGHAPSSHSTRVGSMSTTDNFNEPLVGVTILIADSAQVADSKLYMLGAGLQFIGPRPQPVAVAVIIAVPWDRSGIQHDWQLELLDEDGVPVFHNDRPVMVAGQFESTRPDGWVPGTPMSVPLAVNFSALPVQPDHRYTFRFAVNGTSEPQWSASFGVRPAPIMEA